MNNYYFDNSNIITVYVNGKTIIFHRSEEEELYQKVKELCRQDKYEAVLTLYNTLNPTPEKINELQSDINISDTGVVTINGDILPESLSKVIVALYKEDSPLDCFVNFWNKLKLNPSYKARKRVYDFVNAHNITLLPDGDLLLYKVVRRTDAGYVDIFTKTIHQKIGDTIKMDRSLVDDDNNNTCSVGYHACAYSYINHYGNINSGEDTVILVRVNPMNIVSIPTDYNNAKLRVCEYTILEENSELTEVRQAYYSSKSTTSFEYQEEDEDDEDYLDEWD